MKRLALALALTACGSDPKDAATLVTVEPEPTTETVPEEVDETPKDTDATTEPEPIQDPDGSPESGLVVTSSQFSKFKLAESDCSAERCIVIIKVEQACNAATYTKIALMAYQLKDGFLFRATSVITVQPDWINGNIVTIKLTAIPTQEPSAYASQGYLEQSGVFYNCPN